MGCFCDGKFSPEVAGFTNGLTPINDGALIPPVFEPTPTGALIPEFNAFCPLIYVALFDSLFEAD